MKERWKQRHQRGFTLIELLIVIGLLGALTALVLPSLSAVRTEAISSINSYNVAGPLRFLLQCKQITNNYPTYLHTGYVDSDGTYAMPGLPYGGGKNLEDRGGSSVLSETEAESLAEAGITDLCFGPGSDSSSYPTGAMSIEDATSLPAVAASLGSWRNQGSVL